jgi:hypothetical protein
MIRETIDKLEAEITASEPIEVDRRRELLELLSSLREEINNLADADDEQARSIAAFAGASTHEATRKVKNPELLDLSLKGLSGSVDALETSHPKLTQLVSRICSLLSNLGI